jgi:hypothetical protein
VSRLVAGVLALAAAGAVFYLWPRAPKDPEEQIRKLVADSVAGVEKHDLSPLSTALAPDFRGPQGASGQEVKQLIAGQVLRDSTTVAVFNPSLDVTFRNAGAADINGLFVFSRSKELTADSATAVYRVSAAVEQRDGEWRFTSASYEQATWP